MYTKKNQTIVLITATRPILCVFFISIFFNCLLFQERLYAQEFLTIKVSERVFIISNPEIGSQVVIKTKEGLVIFDSFWSEKTAQLFKKEISKTLGREDFSYLINMLDRLDYIGGNKAYSRAAIVGHYNILTKYSNEINVTTEIEELIDMWRHKEELSRNRLPKYEAGSERADIEKKWLEKCKNRANELETSFSLALPDILYNDKLELNLNDITVQLRYFGKIGEYIGQTVAIIPEEKLAIMSKSIIYPNRHLAPGLRPDFIQLDVARWIKIMEEILEGQNAVEKIILSDDNQVYSKDQMQNHLKYIRTLWNRVTELENEGKSLQEIYDILSLEKEFSFVKEMNAYKENSDQWIRPQHELHTRLFFLQHKEYLASEIIKQGGADSLQNSLEKMQQLESQVYIDETSIWRLGYVWLNEGHVNQAIEIFRLYVKNYPESDKAYEYLAEAYLKNGDIDKAIKNYQKSLELNPDNNNARENLKELN